MEKTLLLKENSKYFRLLLAAVLTVFTFFNASAQVKTVTGRVSDNAGPVPGASVQVKGNPTGTVTDSKGNYRINVPTNAVLVFSFVSYATQEVAVGDRAVVDVVLSSFNRSLDEVVVVGYGSSKRKDLTGSVSSISAAQIEKVPVTTVDQALQGRAAGVQVTNNDGAPGSGVSITIRGVGSFGGTNPLYVVDGYPTQGIGNLNPSDIASIDVLKDASAAAIYGNRASNGVVVITTKRGTKNGAQISFDSYGSIQTTPKTYEVLNASEWATIANIVGVAEGFDRLPEWSNPSALRNLDWQDYAYRTGSRQSYNLSVRGGGEKAQGAVSMSYYDQQGIVIGSWYNRINLSANLDYTPKSWIKSSTSIKFSRNKSRVAFGSGTGSLGNLSKLPPTMTGNKFTDQIDDGNGNYGFYTPTNQQIKNWGNPVYGIKVPDRDGGSNNLQMVSSLEATIWDGLKVKTNFGMNVNNYSDFFFSPTDNRVRDQYGAAISPGQNFYSQNANDSYEYLWENYLTYDKIIGKHTINFVGGISTQKNQFRYLNAGGNNLINDALRNIGSIPQTFLSAGGNTSNSSLTSQFARLNYNFDNKYYVQGTVRRDGSSKFAEGHQYGIFPSGSIMWRPKSEAFLKDVTALSDLKIRASYGEVGNQNNIDAFQYLSLYSPGSSATAGDNNGYPFNKVWQPGYVLAFLPNPNLRWETTKSTNIGIDASFLKGDLTATVEYFRKESKDFLLRVQTPAQTGFSDAVRNVGAIENHGFEFSLNYKHSIKDFNYSIAFNISTITNKVVRLASNLEYVENLVGQGFSNTGANNWTSYTRSYVGGKVGDYYGFKADGLYQTQAEIDALNAAAVAKYGPGTQYDPFAKPGDRKFKDLNGDGKINDQDRTSLGSPIPKFFGGFNLDLSYKQFDMSAFFYGSYGNKIFNYMESTMESFMQTGGGVGIQNISREYAQNAWTATGSTNRYSRITSSEQHGNTRPSDQWIESGSYLRLRNLQIGYSLPLTIAKKITASKVRLYVAAQNLFTITKYSGLDPEIGGNGPTATGIDVGTFPMSKFYTVGLNVTF
ncbi:TonB-dependent receptor [Mucilaginibacter sp.]|uniref:SusC/RagA family TonB-linked outer membrane protein n=1 Tax=Mucilaginibacter sp. TaxID=1882438 RepID=UPI003263F9AB